MLMNIMWKLHNYMSYNYWANYRMETLKHHKPHDMAPMAVHQLRDRMSGMPADPGLAVRLV